MHLHPLLSSTRRDSCYKQSMILCYPAKCRTYSHSEHYELGERAGKILIHQIKTSASANQITEIALDDGTITCNERQINSQFMQFYNTFYTSERATDSTVHTQVLDRLELKGIEESDRVVLDQPMSLEKILKVITHLKSGKAPGPDGFSIEFYKKFAAKVAPIFLEVFEECFNNEALPPMMIQATISVLLKKNKDPTQCGFYRPVFRM